MLGPIVEIRRYCKQHTQIENYEKALNDPDQKWHCHHRLEINEDGTVRSRADLIKSGEYYNVTPDKLIFLTEHDHMVLHHKGVKIPKLSEQFKGSGNPFFGKHHTPESIKKIQSHQCTDELRELRRKNATGRKIVIGDDGKRHWSSKAVENE